MKFVVLDAGALIAVERGNRGVQALLERIQRGGAKMLVPAGVVAEVWRDGARQARVAKLLAAAETEVVPLTGQRARIVGITLGITGADDVVDASVVACAREHGGAVAVLTSDPDDLRALDATLAVVPI